MAHSDFRYKLLMKVLDQIRLNAPEEYRSYRVSEGDAVQRARSKSLLHLFLLVKFGVADFRQRHDFITDGPGDGGVDAYYIDGKEKRLYLVQAKFRAEGTQERSVTADELVRMHIRSILQGEKYYYDRRDQKVEFNAKIRRLQEQWGRLPDQANYEYCVIILGGGRKYSDEQIRRVLGLGEGELYEFYDYERIYQELLLPLCSSTYYDPDEISIELNLKEGSTPMLKQSIETRGGNLEIRVVFVPVAEVGRIMLRYKNAILRYNPRNYLTLSGNRVNRSIRDGILNSPKNDFAIYNNGITMLCREFRFTESTGRKGKGQIIIESPQIVNGGQTAYVLSEIYKDENKRPLLEGKEVLLKVITLPGGWDEQEIREFIADISNATNLQSKVSNADRRSNDEVLIRIQQEIFEKFGYLLERKRGEFEASMTEGYVDPQLVIKRGDLLRAYLAYKGSPSEARRSSEDRLFREERFRQIVGDGSGYAEMVFAYCLLSELREEERGGASQAWGSGW